MSIKRLVMSGFVALALVTTLVPVATPVRAQSHQLKQIGNGTAFAAAWSPNGSQLAIGGSLGIWLYTPHLKPITHFDGNDLEITTLAWNPNSKQIASASHAGEVQLWNVATGKVQTIETTAPDPDQPGSLAYSPDGSRLASANAKNDVHIWDTVTGKLVQTLNTDGPVFAVSWEPNGTRIAVGGEHMVNGHQIGFLQLWDNKADAVVKMFTPNEFLQEMGQDEASAIPPTQIVQWTTSQLAVVFSELPIEFGSVFTWDTKTDQRPADDGRDKLGLSCGDQATGIAFSHDGSSWANGIVRCDAGDPGIPPEIIVNIATEQTRTASQMLGVDTEGLLYGETSGPPVRALAWRNDRTLTIVDGEGIITTLEVDTGTAVTQTAALTDFQDFVPEATIAWSQDGRQLLVTTYQVDNFEHLDMIQITDVLTGTLVHRTVFQPNNGQALFFWALSPNGQWLVSGSFDERMSVYDALTGAPAPNHKPFQPTTAAESSIFLSDPTWNPDNERIAGLVRADKGWTLTVWDAISGKLLVSPHLSDDSACCVQWSPDGNDLAVSGNGNDIERNQGDSSFYVFDVRAAQMVMNVDGDPKLRTLAVVWNPLNQNVANVTSNHSIHLWDMPSGKLLQTLPGHAVEWSADATQLAIAGEDHTVQLYDTKTAKVTAILKSDADSTVSTRFSPDGARIATADSDGAIRVWDVVTGKLLLTLIGHKGAVLWVRWKPDGNQLLSKGADGTLRLWDVHS
ncbi:MAG: WD40 repeat domain-containing protein [Aggregatilineales bacterium]